jgi:hypothetical protein
MLLEKVCLAQNLNNSEAFRTQWQNLRWHPGDDIHLFFTTFEQAIVSICNSHCTGEEAVQDPDKVFRLREALPLDYSEKLLWDAYRYSKGHENYPKYPLCKIDVTTYISNENKKISEETRVAKALSSQRTTTTNAYPRGNKGKKQQYDKKQTTTHTTHIRSTTDKKRCYNCDSEAHLLGCVESGPAFVASRDGPAFGRVLLD